MADYTKYKYVKVEKEGGVAVITLNRPEALNAVNAQMQDEILEIFEGLNEDREVKAAIITGAGKAFCAGADVKGFAAGTVTPSVMRAGGTLGGAHGIKLLDTILNLRMPLISAVNGAAAGLGATLALYADIVIAGESARIGDTHIKAGLVPGDGGVIMFPMLVGLAKAKELLMTGAIVNAKEAERIGLVSRVVPDAELLTKAKELAAEFAAGPTLAIGWTKAALNKKIKAELAVHLDTGILLEALSFLSNDHKEAVKSFIEKRKPKFEGK